jgi:oligopeptide/dipeptide ABC transporter ATP-binding protein
MYAGRIVERGPAGQVVENPQHPYTQGLLACLPKISSKRARIDPIPGEVPDLAGLSDGCAFEPRCPLARPECSTVELRLRALEPGHYARCILHEQGTRYTVEEHS